MSDNVTGPTLLTDVYEIDRLVCPMIYARAGSAASDQRKSITDMKVIAIVEDLYERMRILRHQVKIGLSPPSFGFDRRNLTTSPLPSTRDARARYQPANRNRRRVFATSRLR